MNKFEKMYKKLITEEFNNTEWFQFEIQRSDILGIVKAINKKEAIAKVKLVLEQDGVDDELIEEELIVEEMPVTSFVDDIIFITPNE